MHTLSVAVAALVLAGSAGIASAQTVSPAAVLSEYRIASGGDAWNGKQVMKTISELTDAGIRGSKTTVTDLRYGYSVTHQSVGPVISASGFDGSHAWIQGADGLVSLETGMALPLATDAAYLNANLWWQSSFGGAKVASAGNKRCGESTCVVLKITPKGGLPFQAWFGIKSHLLVRIVHSVGTRTATDNLSEYRSVDGVRIPYRSVINQGFSKRPLLTVTTTSVTFLPERSMADFAPPESRIKNAAIVGDAAQTTFPFQLLYDNIFADVWINRRGPLLFLFDTGGENVLLPSTAKALGIAVEHAAVRDGTREKAVSTGLAKVHSICIGRARFTNQAFGVLDFVPNDLLGLDIKGMIGAPMFRAFVTRLDYGTRQITLIKPDLFDTKNAGTPIPFRLVGSMPVVDGTFDDIPGKFAIDTGANTALFLNRPFAAEHQLRAANPNGVTAMVGHGDDGNIIAYVTRAKLFTIGPFKFPDIVTSISSAKTGIYSMPSFQGTIGNGILKHFVVTLDYASRTMYLKPLGAPLTKVGSYDRSGLALGNSKHGFKVAWVTAHSPAQQAGIELGDIITQVDGEAAGAIPLYKFTAMLRKDPPGTVVRITVKRGTLVRHVTITLRNQI